MRSTLAILLIIITASCNRIKPETRVLVKSDQDSILVVDIPKAGCHNCQKVVEGGLKNFKGVKQTILNLHSKQVSIVYNPKETTTSVLKTEVNSLADKIPCK